MATKKTRKNSYFYNPAMGEYIQEGLEKDFPELEGKIYVYVEVSENGDAIWKCAGRGEKPETSASDEEILSRFKELASEAMEKFGSPDDCKETKKLLLKRREAINFAIFFQDRQQGISRQDKDIMLKVLKEHDKRKKRTIIINGLNKYISTQLAIFNKIHKESLKLTKDERRMLISAYLPDYEEGIAMAEEEIRKFYSMSPEEQEQYLAKVEKE